MTDTERDGPMDHFDDDENVKAMRETARTIGLTALLTDLRQEHVRLTADVDRHRARITEALTLLGVSNPERTP